MIDNIKGQKLTEEELEDVVGGAATGTPPYYLNGETKSASGLNNITVSKKYQDNYSARRGMQLFARDSIHEIQSKGDKVVSCMATVKDSTGAVIYRMIH